MANPEGPDLGSEYVVIENLTEEIVSLDGVYLDDKEGESPPYLLDGLEIQPFGEITLISEDTGISLNNNYDEVRILDENLEPIITIELPESLEGLPYPSITSINYELLPTTLRITEIMPNPEEEETTSEWVEIQNIGPNTENFQGILLDDSEDGSSPFELPETVLAPYEFTVIYRSESGIALNNSSDSVRLLTPDEEIIDEIEYEKTKEGISYQLVTSINPTTGISEEQWQWDTPTEGSENTGSFHLETKIIEYSEGILSTESGTFQTSNLEEGTELLETIFQPETEITITYRTINGENQITSYELETKEEESMIAIQVENEKQPLYKELLPYIVTVLAVVLLSIYEIKNQKTEIRN